VDNLELNLDVVTLKKTIFRGMVESVTAPGTVGYFGILKGHTPFVSSLQPGIFSFVPSRGEKKTMAISGGFLSTDGKQVIVLADAAESPEEIDADRARASRDRAQKRLAESPPDLDHARAKASLARASARLKLAGAS
jgi:F-type H+-transporting ATPase subunit epsilon